MKWKIEGQDLLIKLEKGDPVKESILSVAKSNGIGAGSILWAVGMMRDLEIGYFNGREYEKEKYGGPLEVVSFHGSIAENDPELHIHTSVAGKDHRVIGGHLFEGTADPLLEIHIQKFDTIRVMRKYSESSTLKEMELDQ